MPNITGLHHVAILVPDLEAAAAWYERVLGAERLSGLDHHDATGVFAVILEVPGMPGVLQLRRSEAALPPGYDPLTLEVANERALETWVAHLDQLGVAHSGVLAKRTGSAIEVPAAGGALLRLYTAPIDGFRAMLSNG